MNAQPPRTADDVGLRLVTVGGSAGALSAFCAFFEAVPSEPGMAFVVLQHLPADAPGHLPDLLDQRTSMTVVEAEEGMAIEANHVYVGPPGKWLVVREDGRFGVEVRRAGRPVLVDVFLRSSTTVFGSDLVAVIVSGTGDDGALGCEAVHRGGGFVLAQEPDEADQPEMPQAVIDLGVADMVAPAAELAERLADFEQDSRAMHVRATAQLEETASEAFEEILAMIRATTGHDFGPYKRSTILRRIHRRMNLHGIDEVPAYLVRLSEEPGEIRALFEDLLIGVTSFFRDPETFEVLTGEHLAPLFAPGAPEAPARIWVCGCASGEEAYTLAMLLTELRQETGSRRDFQIFATDIDARALAVAREALYPSAAVAAVGASRLRRHFIEMDDCFRVCPELRETVLFAPHNVLRDPPFSRLDLICCRNLLIYLERDVHRKVFEIFHYALKEEGTLVLGAAESGDLSRELFTMLDEKNHILRRNPGASRPRMPGLPLRGAQETPTRLPGVLDLSARPSSRIDAVHHRLIAERLAPPSFLVDPEYRLLHTSGGAGRFLRHVDGPPTDDLLETIHPDLRARVRSALFAALNNGEPARYAGVPVCFAHGVERVDVAATPAGENGWALLVLEPGDDAPDAPGDQADGVSDDDTSRLITSLEEELRVTRDRLHHTREKFESSNEQLKGSNEELQSMNEELRSATEELETSREELQSMNEELAAVNQELHVKLEELTTANEDLQNLMSAADVGILFLDAKLRLKRFTDRARGVFHVVPADLGRPLAHFNHRICVDDLVDRARVVLQTGRGTQSEERTADGGWVLLRLAPYLSQVGANGVVISFVDITAIKRAEASASRRARQLTFVADFGRRALDDESPAELMSLACKGLREVLDVDYTKVLEHRPERHDLLIRAGEGWTQAEVGVSAVPDDDGSQGGYTLVSQTPVLVENLPAETRFRGPDLLLRHEVHSGMSVTIHGDGRPWGVLGVHDRQPRRFNDDDVRCLEAVAHILGQALTGERTQLTLSEERLRLRRTVEEAPIPIMVRSEEGMILQVNRAWQELSGYGADELQTVDDWIRLAYPGHEAEYREIIERSHAFDGRQELGEIAIRTRAGDERVWKFSISSLGHDDLGRRLFVTMATDVTSLTRTQEALRDARQRAEAASEAKSRFLASMSHDLRTPLSTMLGHSHLLEDEELSEDGVESVEAIRAAVLNLKRSLDAVLEFVRLEYGVQADAAPEDVDLVEEARRMATLFEMQAEEAGIALVVEAPDEPVVARIDRNALERILLNLVGNAVKFTEEGRVTVRIYEDPRDDALPGRPVSTAVIEVEDTGIGIDDAFLPHVFDMFAQESSGDARTHGGTGIGLSIVDHLVAMNRGSIRVESEKGRGSRFIVRLPMGVGARATPPTTTRPTIQGPRRRVLVVEDNTPTRRTYERLLRAHHDARLVATFDEATEIADVERFDVLLLDINLGEARTGVDLLRVLRSRSGYADVPAIACTAHAGPLDADRFLAAGFDAYLQKPFEPDELLALLASFPPAHLRRASSEAEIDGEE